MIPQLVFVDPFGPPSYQPNYQLSFLFYSCELQFILARNMAPTEQNLSNGKQLKPFEL